MRIDLIAVKKRMAQRDCTPCGKQAAGETSGRDGELTGVRIFEMDASGREVRGLVAEHAIVPRGRAIHEWTLQDVTETNWIPATPTSEPAETSPAAANEPVSRCTYSSAEMPIIAIGNRASSDATAGPREPRAVSAVR